jgi:hypothetical protein
MIKRTFLVAAIAIGCAAGAANAQAPVADFFSTSSQKDGQTMAAGTVIEAYDGDGIRCGYAEVNASGGFLMHVYGNDPMTPGIDEGAAEGEMLQWRVDGIEVPSEDAIWIANLIGLFTDLRWENGAAKEIRLDVRTTGAQTSNWSDVKALYRH